MLNIIEEMAKGRIESQYLTDKKYSFSIALESVSDTDWFWTPEEHEKFDALWSEEIPMEQMAEEMNRSEMAVFLNALDRMANGFIKPRQGWKIW